MVLPLPLDPVPFTIVDIGNLEQIKIDSNATAVSYFDTSYDQVLFKDYRYVAYLDGLEYSKTARHLYNAFDGYTFYQGISWVRSDDVTSFSRGIFT